MSKKCNSPNFRPVNAQISGPIKATQEFSKMCQQNDNVIMRPSIRRAASLETLNKLSTVSTVCTQTDLDSPEVRGAEVRGAEVRRHRRSSSLGNCELKEKLRRSLLREKQTVVTHGPICGAHAPHSGVHAPHSALVRTVPAEESRFTAVPGVLIRTKSMDCLNSEIEKLTISSSPLSAHTPHDGHKAPLPADTTTFNTRFTQTPDSDNTRQTAESITPPEESTSPWDNTRSPEGHSSPDQYNHDKIGSSPRVNCSFLFAQRPPSTAAQSTCVRYNIAPLIEPLGPDKSKIKIIFSSNSVFNRPGSCYRLSPAEQICS